MFIEVASRFSVFVLHIWARSNEGLSPEAAVRPSESDHWPEDISEGRKFELPEFFQLH